MKEKSLTIKNESFLDKIKKFFKSLFFREEQSDNTQFKKVQETSNIREEFTKDIRIEEDKEKQRLLQIQNKIRNKQIEEKDISEEDKKKLRELYNKQITHLKESIQEHKQAILSIRTKIKANQV